MMKSKYVNGVKIEDGVEVPEGDGPRGSWKPILDQMSVGQSFLLPEGSSRYARQSIMAYGRSRNRKFIVRMTEKGRRCFRIE